MKLLKNRSIATRMRLGFGLLILVSIAVALFGRLALEQVGGQVRALTEHNLVVVTVLSNIKDNVNLTARAARNIALQTDPQGKLVEKNVIDGNRASTRALLKQLEDLLTLPEEQAKFKEVSIKRLAYAAKLDQSVKLGLEGNNEAARDLLVGEVTQLQKSYFTELDDLIAWQRERMETARKTTDGTVRQAGYAMLALLGVAMVSGGLIANWTARSVTRPLLAAVHVTQRIAEGDLSTHVEPEAKDEVGRLMDSLKQMQESLRNLVGMVRSSSDAVALGASEIAASNSDMSHRTEQQAASLEETAAAMEQISTMVRSSETLAQEANDCANAANGAAQRGGDVVSQVVSTMSQINVASQRISDIVSVIDGIAFQTNILALNAAVEAARAGEQGRGFAVVASEVRSLAQRSATAAREIKTLISSNVEKVDAGSRLVETAGTSMVDIRDQVGRVVTLIAELGAMSSSQSKDIVQVNQSVADLDQATQQNSAMVEESAAAADSLSQQARLLVDAISAFRLQPSERTLAVV
ncbi:methyl-accepting chemotaxis protein [Rhodoferax sp. TH121]|uniref:methyl-accepting chemotaxis protein n=1 Tax=Rhodoferax sp. TH121 TaxID=2022803 RepID=UPI001596377C|nr:methyl-accepting chemotaxis protein [Rhodoferax sp. TH121]